MKKLICFSLALVMLLSLAACDGIDENVAGNTPDIPEENTFDKEENISETDSNELSDSSVSDSVTDNTDTDDYDEIVNNDSVMYNELSDILTEEQINLHDKADTVYICFRGHPGHLAYLDSSFTDSLNDSNIQSLTAEDAPERYMINGITFFRCKGKISTMSMLRELALSVFTEDCLKELNYVKDWCLPIYMEINGQLYFWDLIETGGDSVEKKEYEVLSYSENEIIYNMINYVKRRVEDDNTVEYVTEKEVYLYRLVLTNNGWRYDKFRV